MNSHHAKGAVVGVVAFLVVIGLCVGGYLGYFWIKGDSLSRTNQIRRGSYEYQQTLRDEARQKISDVAAIDVQIVQNPDVADALRAQRKRIVADVCNLIVQVTGDNPVELVTFRAEEC